MSTKKLSQFARQLVKEYCVYDRNEGCYTISLKDIADFDLHHFASLFLLDRTLANEALGSDNPNFEKMMLPALINLLSNSKCPEERIEFIQEMIDGVMSYFEKDMQQLLDEELQLYNMEYAA